MTPRALPFERPASRAVSAGSAPSAASGAFASGVAPWRKGAPRPTGSGGFSLVELLVVMVVMGTLAALLFPMLFAARRAVQADQIRVGVAQQLRTAADLVGSDIRTAGERFPRSSALQLLPIEIVKGTGGAPDELLLRRNLWEGTLPLCQPNLAGNNQNVTVAAPPGANSSWNAYPECIQPYLQDQWPRNLAEIRDLAAEIGDSGVLRGYLWNPTLDDGAGLGEFFSFEVPGSGGGQGGGQGQNRQLRRVSPGAWQFTHSRDDFARIYILEERRYRVVDGVLEVVVNGDEDGALRAVAGIEAFVVQYVLEDDSVVDELPASATWRQIRGVQVTLTSAEERGREAVERTLSSTFFPRNVLSR